MRCPFCGFPESKVTDSRDNRETNIIRRRRECLAESCGKRFTTYERVEQQNLMVIKKDDTRQPFSNDKLLSGMLRACANLPIPVKKLEEAANDIEQELYAGGYGEVRSEEIGKMVLNHLKGLDDVAYVRFVSVYRNFTNVTEFYAELLSLMQEKPAVPAPNVPEEPVPEPSEETPAAEKEEKPKPAPAPRRQSRQRRDFEKPPLDVVGG
jgi:transcriptional repressor NrdR